MIRLCPRNHPAEVTSSKRSFFLFKPLIAIASLTIMFELLPIDFQYCIAPSLVTYDRVFWAASEAEGGATCSPELIDDYDVKEESSHYLPGYSDSL